MSIRSLRQKPFSTTKFCLRPENDRRSGSQFTKSLLAGNFQRPADPQQKSVEFIRRRFQSARQRETVQQLVKVEESDVTVHCSSAPTHLKQLSQTR